MYCFQYDGIGHGRGCPRPGDHLHRRVSPASAGPENLDLTARARIRVAAMRLFGDRGAAGTTMRDVARHAGVSTGLVQHHFGTKDALRAACDEHALDELVRAGSGVVPKDGPAVADFVAASARSEVLGPARYLARSMLDGSPAAARVFDRVLGATEAWVTTQRPGLVDDERAGAALLVAMAAGVLALSHQLSTALGGDVLGPEGHRRLMRAAVELSSTPLLGPEAARQALDALDASDERAAVPRRGPARGGA